MRRASKNRSAVTTVLRAALLRTGGAPNPGVVDWAAACAAAGQAGLGALLFDAVHRFGWKGQVPEPLLRQLGEAAAAAAMRAALLRRAEARATSILAAGGIRSLPLKGLAIARVDPAYFALRFTSDVDLLVAPGRVNAAFELLREAGYVAQHAGPSFDGHGPAGADESTHHHAPLVSSEGVAVELHRRLPGVLGDDEVTAAAWARSWPRGSLDLEDQVGIACLHAMEGHAGDPAFLPRLIADLEVLVGVGASLQEARGRFGQPVEVAVKMLEATRAAVLDPAAARAQDASLILGRPGSLTSNGVALRRRWRLVKGLVGSAGWRGVFPDPRFMAARYGVREGSPWVPLLYLWRPVRGLWRLASGR